MSIVRRIVRRDRESRTGDLAAYLLAQRGNVGTYAGTYVNDDQAMRLDAVWACVQLKANQLSTLPLNAYRKQADGSRVEVVPAPSLIREPSAIVDRASWIWQLSVSLDFRGNAYGLVFARDARGWPTQVELFHPDDVSVTLTGRPGVPSYRFAGVPVDPLDVFHVAENLVPGSPVGLGPIEYARQSIGLGLAVDEFGARFFGDGAHPTGVLETDKEVTREQADTIRQRFTDATAGSRGVAVLGLGVNYRAIQVNPEDSQFLETEKWTVNRIASRFHVPAEFVGGTSGDSMTYSNVESRYLNLLALGLAPRMARIEAAFNRITPAPMFAKFNEAAFLRTDTKTAHEIVASDLRVGLRTVDEGRAIFDLPPLPDDAGARAVFPPYRAFPLESDGPTAQPGGTPNGDAPPEGTNPE